MKKRLLSMLIALMLLLSFPVAALANDEEEIQDPMIPDHSRTAREEDLMDAQSDFELTSTLIREGDWDYYINGDGTATLKYYYGTDTDIITPSMIGGAPVTIIGSGAFAFLENITSVSISEGVTQFGDEIEDIDGTLILHGDVFWGCHSLTYVSLPTTLLRIGTWCFDDCPVLDTVDVITGNPTFRVSNGVLFSGNNGANEVLEFYSRTKSDVAYTIPNSVKKIENGAIEDNRFLQELIIPASVQENQSGVWYMPALNTVIVEEGATSIGGIFSCPALTTVKLPSTLKTIGEDAFFDCTSLTNITLPNSLERIGRFAFLNTGFTTISIPSSVKKIDQWAFAVCKNLNQAVVYSNDVYYNNDGYDINTIFGDSGSERVVIYGNSGSTTQAYAEKYGFKFTALIPVGISCTKTDATIYGAANGSVTITASGGNSGSYDYSLNGGASWQAANTFSGLAAGTYTVNVRDVAFPGNSAACSVIVGQPAYVGAISANKVPTKVNVSTALTIVPPAAPKGYTVQSVSYSSSNPAVATVDASGNVSFIAGGKVTIITKVVSQTVDKKGKVKTKITTVKKTINVRQPIGSISLNMGSATIARTQKVKLAAAIAPGTASNKKVKWTSSNKKVATVSSAGAVTGKAGGTAVITCTAADGSGISASCTVNVTPIYPTAVKLSKTVLTVKIGKTTALKATIAPKNTDFKTVTWASSNPAVAAVDAKGKIKAMAPGTAVITATTSSGQTASCTVTVN